LKYSELRFVSKLKRYGPIGAGIVSGLGAYTPPLMNGLDNPWKGLLSIGIGTLRILGEAGCGRPAAFKITIF
jgi:hypothetical protein